MRVVVTGFEGQYPQAGDTLYINFKKNGRNVGFMVDLFVFCLQLIT